MSTHIRLLVVVSLLVVASAVIAAQVLDGVPSPTDPVDLPTGLGDPATNDPPTSVCINAYSDLLLGTTFLPLDAPSPFTGTPYVEYADDCHLTSGGALCSFTIGYFAPTPPTVDFTITLYENDPTDGILGPPVAGPYLFTGLPSGLNELTLVPPTTPIIPADVWFAVTASPLSAGLVIASGPPTVGVSHDVFLDVPNAGLVFFGGDPLANFMIRINADPAVATEEVTWGRIKSLYDHP